MHRTFRVALPILIVAGVSCAKQAPAPAAAPAPAPAPTAAATGAGAAQAGAGRGGQAAAGAAAGQAAGGRGGAAGGAPARVQLTPEQRAARRDSLTAERGKTLAVLKQAIAGRDSEPASAVFKNVQINKDAKAALFLNSMDNVFGRALSVDCTFCHVADKWDDDSKQAKKTTRIMLQLVAAINTEQLSKMPPNRAGNTPRIGCVTCHRGNTSPGNALLP